MTAVEAHLGGLTTPHGEAHLRPDPGSVNGSNPSSPGREGADGLSSMPSMNDLEPKCGGCKKTIDQENGGVVVAFGASLWHVDCFKCAKCQEKVSADTNLLLLSDGSPVCGKCSYQCFVCKQAITEEAIMTGDESYHAHCFTCRTCKQRIEELVFAKTTQGIYCMNCHNERVARSRRHAEAKRQRAARKEREKEEAEARRRERESSGMRSSTTSTSLNLLTTVASNVSGASGTVSPSSPRYPDATSPRSIASHIDGNQAGTSPLPRAPSPAPGGALRNHSVPASPAGPRAPREAPMARAGSQDSRTPRSGNASPTPGSSSNKTSPMALSQSQSAGNILSQSTSRSPNGARSSSSVGLGVSGLSVPTSRAEKRRSINPGLSFNMDQAASAFSLEPRAPSPLRASFGEPHPEDSALSQDSNAPTTGPPTPTPTSQARMQSPGTSPTLVATPKLLPQSPAVAATPVEKSPDLSDKSSPKSEATSGTRAQVTTAETTPKSSEPSHDGHRSPSAIKPPILPPERKDSHVSTNGDASLPRIDAPNLLPTMSFSLSDPDFAVLLNEMETAEGSKSSPQKSRAPEATSDAEDAGGGVTSRGANMNPQASSANGEAITPSVSRTLLSPNDQPSPISTLRRRGSKESIMSVRMEPDSSFQALAELLAGLKPDDDNKVSVNYSLLTEAVREHNALKEAADTLKAKYTGAKRSSQQYSDGLVIAGEEYDKESQRRRELETEIARLRSQLHGQSARLSLISSDERRQERLNRRSQDLASNLTGLERDISRLRAQRDISLAEIEELQSKRGEIDSEEATSKVSRSLSRRLDKIKEEYRDELAPLSAQREALQREIADLEATKEQYIEEAASLQAKNDEISELNQQLMRQNEALSDRRSPAAFPAIAKARGHPSGSPSMSSLATALEGVPEESKETARVIKVSKPEPIEVTPARRFKWIGKAAKAVDTDKLTVSGGSGGDKRKLRPATEVGTREHHFTQHSTMRLGRCDLCQDKMWGLQEVKCSACGIVCHQKCAEKLPKSCTGKGAKVEDEGPLPPSMFGRDLSEQAAADNAAVPVIVTKCIRAVEANGMEYEGIYRKTGGNAQCKQITQLFERGKYETFDLTNADDFNDISAITSVLKNYFRNLPDPVFTHKLHESFIAAANIRGADNKKQALCALLQELPKAHYDTLKVLMLHLNRVTAKNEVNLMTSQNIGVVFGPTLLRSSDPNREFGDMAGKALSVQWMVENAPSVFLEERE